jgi:hypothetical protein
VYHGEYGLRTLKELVRSYLTITKDLARVKSRVKAIYRSWAIPCTGKQVYARCHRVEWLGKISEPGVRRRAEFYYQQLDALRVLRQALIRVTSYRRSPRGKTQRRSIIRLTRMPRIRQLDGLNLSIVCSISPFRAAAYINSDRFS